MTTRKIHIQGFLSYLLQVYYLLTEIHFGASAHTPIRLCIAVP